LLCLDRVRRNAEGIDLWVGLGCGVHGAHYTCFGKPGIIPENKKSRANPAFLM